MFDKTLFSSPFSAGIVAAVITCVFMFCKNKIDKNDKDLPMSYYAKPALYCALLVAFIIYMGGDHREEISKDSFD